MNIISTIKHIWKQNTYNKVGRTTRKDKSGGAIYRNHKRGNQRKKRNIHRKYGPERDEQNEERPIRLEGRMD